MSKIAHFRVRIKRERKLIPEWTAERCRAEAADCRRAGDIAAFMDVEKQILAEARAAIGEVAP